MSTLKTRSKSSVASSAEPVPSQATGQAKEAKPVKQATAKPAAAKQTVKGRTSKPTAQVNEPAADAATAIATPVPEFQDVLVPKAFLAIAIDAGIFLIGSLPENAPKITALGFYGNGADKLVLCCVPEKGGVLLVDPKPFVEQAGAAGEVREQKFLGFLPIPAKLLAPKATLNFGAVQENGVHTRFPIEVTRMKALDDAMRESVMREYRHLFGPAVTKLLPANHPLRNSGPAKNHMEKPATAEQASPVKPAAAPVGTAQTTIPAVPKAALAPARQAPPPHMGFFDEIVESRAEGWAFDPANPKQRVIVEILEGDRVVARGVADRFRDDLLNAGIGDGRYCYKLPISYELRDGKPHQLTARVALTKQALKIKGGGDSHAFEVEPVDMSEYDLIPPAETLELATSFGVSLDTPEAQKAFAFAFGKANLALEMRELTEAARSFLDLAHKYGEQALFFCKLGESYLLGGRNLDAVRAYQQAVERSPEYGWAWLGMACAYRLQGSLVNAVPAYEKAQKLLPGFSPVAERLLQVNTERARSMLKEGKRADAVACLKKHLAQVPDDEGAWELLGQALAPAEDALHADPFAYIELSQFAASKELLDTMLDLVETSLQDAK